MRWMSLLRAKNLFTTQYYKHFAPYRKRIHLCRNFSCIVCATIAQSLPDCMLSPPRPFDAELRRDYSVRAADSQRYQLARLDIILVDLRQQSGSRTEDAVPGPLRLAIQQDLRPNLEPRADDQQLPVSEQFGVGDYRIAGNNVEFGDEYILGAALCSLQRILHRKVGRISHSHYVGFAL